MTEKVEYTLTPLGASLSDPIATIRSRAYHHMDQINNGRTSYVRCPDEPSDQ